MSKVLRVVLVVVCAGLSAAIVFCKVHAQDTAPLRERIEWCDIWFTDADKVDRPRVLLIGDSITRGYFDKVEREVGERAYLSRWTTSRSVCDPVFFQELRLMLGQYSYAVIHFNNGLHGWGYSEEEYKKGLTAFFDALQELAPQAKLVWTATTPVREDSSMGPHTKRVLERNRIAAELAGQRDIPTDDLCTAMHGQEGFYSSDGVHFNEEGKKVQAAQVAASVIACLPAPTSP